MATVIGDIGCSHVDVDDWRRRNRAPLYPEKINRWVLVRTLRDNPTPAELRETLAVVLVHWFDGSVFEPLFRTTRSGLADLIRIEKSAPERILLPKSILREDLPGVTPTPREGPTVWLEVSFAYRGQQKNIPWPVFSAALTNGGRYCPIGADWVLDAVAEADQNAPPEQSGSGWLSELLREKASSAGDAAKDAASGLMGSLWAPLAIGLGVGLGIYLLTRQNNNGTEQSGSH